MQRNFLFVRLLLSLITSSLCGSNVNAQSSFDDLIVFGDSLSDTGNLASATTNFPFPFFQNRISDGPLMVDYLAESLGFQARASEESNGTNFAVAGGNILGSDIEDLGAQVNSFLSRGQTSQPVSSDSLYFVMMGGNDLRDIRSFNSTSAAEAQISLVLDQLETQLNRLYDAGARTFLIANVANIGRIPETLARQDSDPAIVTRAEAYVRIYNQALGLRLDAFRTKPGVSLSVFDLFAELERLIRDADALGFTQTEEGCFRIDDFSFQRDCVFGTRFDRFVFFDSIHPTGKSNRLVSTALIDSVPVPNSVERPGRAIMAPIIQLLLLE